MTHRIAADRVLDPGTALGECPVWDAAGQRLCFVDIDRGRFHACAADGKEHRQYELPDTIGAIAPRARGGWVAAMRSGIFGYDPGTGQLEPLASPAEHNAKRCRFNDGKCDPQGRFWAGTLSLTDEAGAGALYCFAPGAPPRLAVDKVTCSNGLAWTADGRSLYYIDSRTRRVDVFRFDAADGTLADRRPAISRFADGAVPDGCAIDSDDMLWVALWDGFAVERWDPRAGTLLARVELPVGKVTSCAFGGPAWDTLYITTATGGVFACRPGISGPPTVAFAG